MSDNKLLVFDLSRLVVEQGQVPTETSGYSDPAIIFEDYTGGKKPFRITLLHMGVHSGTHYDTPSHFLFDENGPLDKTVTDYDVSTFVGRAVLLNFYNHGPVTANDLLPFREMVAIDGGIPVIRNGGDSKDSLTPEAREEISSWRPKYVVAGEGWNHVSPYDPLNMFYPDTEFFLREARIPVLMDPDHVMMSRVRDGDLLIAAPVKFNKVEAAFVRFIAIRGL